MKSYYTSRADIYPCAGRQSRKKHKTAIPEVDWHEW